MPLGKGRRRVRHYDQVPWEEVLVWKRPRRKFVPTGTNPLTTFLEVYEEGYRVENVAWELFELYVGLNGPVDFSAPVATSPTLPFSWVPPLPSSGNLTVNCVTRYRNNYNLESFNVYASVVEFVAHAKTLGPISPPRNVAVYNAGIGMVRVITKYVSSEDANPADTWLIYARVGADPTETSAYLAYFGPMTFLGVESALSTVIGTYAPGSVLHVLAVAERSSDGRTAAAPVVLFTLAESLDLNPGDAALFNGQTDMQD